MHRFILAAVLLIGAAILIAVNAAEHDRSCDETANLTSRGLCFMRIGFEADRNGQPQAAVENIRLAREADPKNATLALYQCQWLAKIQDQQTALSACEEVITLAPGDNRLLTAAYVQMLASAEAVGNPDLVARSCAALRSAGTGARPACS